MAAGDQVNVVNGKLPKDYHCRCEFCKKYIGELRPADGSYYSRLERRQYYAKSERGKGGHIAKTPLHIARWAVQKFTDPGDWVLDPTIGAGTTAVEAVTQKRSVAGMELEYGSILKDNVELAMEGAPRGVRAEVAAGDARNIGPFLKKLKGVKFKLVVNNPPYFGDVSMPSPSAKGRGKEFRDQETRFDYDKSLPNLAFLKEGEEYWETMRAIYQSCLDRCAPSAHFVIGVKDQMRNWKSDQLHKKFCEMMRTMHVEFVGTALLKHYPTTLAMNTYANKRGNVDHVPPALYQTISVFKKA